MKGFIKKNSARMLRAGVVVGTVVGACAARATDPPGVSDIVTAGTTIAGYAGDAAAAGVLIMVVIFGVRKAKAALKAGS